jgi:magnesium chelatase family protein
MTLRVSQPDPDALNGPAGEPSSEVRERVLAARERQGRRLGPGRVNAGTAPGELRTHCRIDGAARRLLDSTTRGAEAGLSGRGHGRVLRVARTVADLEGAREIGSDHLLEALALRRQPET